MNNFFTDRYPVYESKTDNPTADNDMCDTAGIGLNVSPGTIWINNTTEQAFLCIKCTEKAAVWKQITT